MGLTAALAGVFIRTGSIVASGERVVCGLAQQFGSLCFVDDNAGCFGSSPLPASGRIICFGAHQVFVATELPRVYPAMVHVAEDPPSVRSACGRSIAPSAGCAEVMMTAPADPKECVGPFRKLKVSHTDPQLDVLPEGQRAQCPWMSVTHRRCTSASLTVRGFLARFELSVNKSGAISPIDRKSVV